MKHIFLTGFMGTGKTTISKALREILSCDVIDMDREIERMERMSIPEYFVQKGETWFRQCETSFLEGLEKERGSHCILWRGCASTQRKCENNESVRYRCTFDG